MDDWKKVEQAFIKAFALVGDDGIHYVARLGYTTVDYSRLMARDISFYRQLAREMSQLTTLSEDLLFRQMVEERNDAWMKNPGGEDLRYFRDASERLLSLLSRIPERTQKALVMRMHRKSWRDVANAHPDRVLFSLRDDYVLDLNRFFSTFGHAVRVLV